ncbi:MAG TPA: hypothetical protein VHK47_09265 [Polyangia bacterium]|jgi:hypothetical protein|nr:hypothetical protein [Polyangia bacterium]
MKASPCKPGRGLPAVVGATVLALLASAAEARTSKPPGKRREIIADASCVERPGAAIWISPEAPVAGEPLRVLAVAENDASGALVSIGADGKPALLETTPRGAAPGSLSADIPAPRAGRVKIVWKRGEKTVACRAVDVAVRAPRPERASDEKGVWTTRRAWDRRTEDFYSAWIERLFDAPVGESLDFRPLHQALRDRARNFLFGYLGLGEDDPKNKAAVPATPDCADLPYYLRAYFAWKMGLPVGFRDCDRGTESRPPRCSGLTTNEDALPGPGRKGRRDALAGVRAFLRLMSNHVQSGSARTALDDEETDYYPVRLDRKALRPGVVYADPYGHVMMIVHWAEQTKEHGGLLLAVDGQPDTSVGRKRFWEGTFLFTNDTKSAGPGFKAFRPLARGASGALEPVPNAAIGGADDPAHAPFSLEQGKLSPDEFYARMGKLINPAGLDPADAYAETLDALVEQLKVRVGSVDNGEKYMRENGNPVVPMPEGAKIFETTGPWEDYATPSRDMRLIIAMNVLLGLPERVVRHPELFNLGGRKAVAVAEALRALHARSVRERGIEYRRSDGSTFKLTVADLLERKAALEIAYNPNDCVETRWGATPGSPEASTCARHAPPDQQARMAEARSWFHDARRPPR